MAKRIDTRPLLVLAVGTLLAGCINFSSLDDLQEAPPPKDSFNLALYKNYAFLARSFGDVGKAQYSSFDQEASVPLADTDATVAGLANTYAEKALQLTRDQVVDPEPSRDIKTHQMRDRLVRALDIGRDSFPRDAARAQADWDCWRLDLAVPATANAAEQCRRSFEVTLPRLETEVAAVAAAKAKEDEAKKAAQKEAGEKAPGADDSEMP